MITKQDWSGWSVEQPEPVQESRQIKSGDIITLVWYPDSDIEAALYINSIDNEKIELRFVTTGGIVKENDNGTINLLSKEYNWTDSVYFGEQLRLVTQTMDGGCSWTLSFYNDF
jgi:23S rRNA G2069 N7-methylase RlmK/C1962 C5-methylase RlmI